MKIKFPPVVRLVETLKDSLLGALCQHTFYAWLAQHDPSFNRYTRELLDESFKEFSNLLSCCLYDMHMSSGNHFVSFRDALLRASFAQFSGQNLTEDDEQTLACFEDFICKSTKLTPSIVRERMSPNNWKHALVERGLWSE